MKLSLRLRLPFTIFSALAIFTLLNCRTSVRRTLGSPSTDAVIALPSNATFPYLASDDPSEAVLTRDIDALLAGSFPYSPNHVLALLRRYKRHLNAGIESEKDWRDSLTFSEFRQSLISWWRNRLFQVEIMSELVGLVKRPLDLHAGHPDSDHRYSSCAVVGNSGILLNAKHGDLIDSHELVIRLNNARTDGYRHNVGSKTDLSFVNSNIFHLCARRNGCFCHPYGEHIPIIIYICQAVHFFDFAICNSSHRAPLLITDIRFDMLCTRIVKYYSLKRFVDMTGHPIEDWAKFHDEKMFHYSSGMQAVMLALGICDRVSIFGFGKKTEAKHHYHTNQKAELDLHDYEAEYALYRDLVARPEAVPYLQGSGFRVPPLAFYH